MVEIYIGLASVGSIAASGFAYLKYRAYLALVRHVADHLGSDGLRELGPLSPPDHGLRHLTHDFSVKQEPSHEQRSHAHASAQAVAAQPGKATRAA